ncbi:MAG: hypothetical protein H0V63_02995 [Burkholderiaceae bacterium]|nr:hypothetical protein [Burkholderiaceae bacterium]
MPIIRSISVSLTALVALVIPATAAEPLPSGALRVQLAEIVDRQGFEKPMVAFTMMVPAGWRYEGAVDWKVGVQCASAYQPRLRAQAPDGSAAIELLPGESWAANNFGPQSDGCPHGTSRNAQEYLNAWVQRHRPGARWIDYRPRPERSHAGVQQSMAGGGFFKSWSETGQALIGYTQNGREMRESLAVSIMFSHSQFAAGGGRMMQSVSGKSYGVLAWRAPEGQLDFRHFDAVWQTLRRGEAWNARITAAENQMAQDNAQTQARVSQIQAQTSRDTLAEIAKRGQIRAQTRAEISEMQNRGYAARAASSDRMHRDNIKTIREVETYREPRSGGVVELPNHYRHAWQLKDGTYVLTDSQAFEPGRDLGVAGERLQVVK